MHLRFLAASLLMGAVILFVPASAYAVPITVHTEKKVPVVREVTEQKNIAGDPMLTTAIVRDIKTVTVEQVVHVAPRDRDDDGVADSEDDCVFCEPEPVYASTASSYSSGGYSGDGTSSSPVDGYYGTGDAIPSYITECESGGSYDAYNPSSGATGAYQIIPSTAAAYGCDLSYPAGQDACASEIYANEGASAWACG